MSLTERMKSYENNEKFKNDDWVIIRVDGKNFHSWTRQNDAKLPFDSNIMEAMDYATSRTSKHMQGFTLAYTQSDEATFALNVKEPSQPWFDNKVNKLVSITASMFTYFFNDELKRLIEGSATPAFFDARAFTVPEDDVPNVFVWRKLDWERNATMMAASSLYSHKELQGKNRAEQQQMIADAGGFTHTPRTEHGSIILSCGTIWNCNQDYYGFEDLLGIHT